MSQILHFQAFLQIDLTCPLTFICDLWPREHMKVPSFISMNQVWFQSDLNFSNEVKFTFWAHLTTWPLMTFDLGKWPLTVWTYKGSHIVSIKTKLGSNRTSTFTTYSLTSDDIWPWYVTFDLINKWGFPCCIYDPSLVEIHQSMRKIEPNVNLFSQQPTDYKNRQQQWTKWSLCVFLA